MKTIQKVKAGGSKFSKDSLGVLHLQDLMKAIKRGEIEKIGLENPLLEAITQAIQKGSEDGMYYLVREDPKFRDFKFSFIGTGHQSVAKAPQNLTTKNLFHQKCRKCHMDTPVIRISIFDRFFGKTLFSFLTIECGELILEGEVKYEDLLKEEWS